MSDVSTEAAAPEANAKYGQAFQENGALLVRWAHETRHVLVMEFIADNDLYPRLNDFLRKKIR
jgi:hypothetical protein